MAARKRKSPLLPVSPSALLEAIGLAEEQSVSQCRLKVLVDSSLDPALVAYAKERFRPQSDNVALTVEPYADAPVPVDGDTALLVLLAAEGTATGRILIDTLKAQVPVVAVTLDAVYLVRTTREQGYELDLDLVVTVDEAAGGKRDVPGERDTADDAECERFARLFAALGEWIVRECGDGQLALARAFDFVRAPFVENAIQATSLQNAVIAAVFFLPGADMPVLTLNQARLFLRIAAAYDATVDRQRLKELAALLLGGLGFRALARRLVGVVPVLGWAVRGAVGYTGTLAVGKATREYFERGGELRLIAQSLGVRRGSRAAARADRKAKARS